MSSLQYLHRSAPKPYDTGSFTSDTDYYLQDIPHLSTLGKIDNDQQMEELLLDNDLPRQIKLRLLLKPVPLEYRRITAQLKVKNQLWNPCLFYDQTSIQTIDHSTYERSKWSRIDIILEGTTSYYLNNQEEYVLTDNYKGRFQLSHRAHDLLHQYQFVLPNEDYYLQEQNIYQQKYWLINVNNRTQGMNIVAFIPYAGLIPDLIDVQRICQVYAIIMDGGAFKTQLALYTQLLCQTKSIKFSAIDSPTRYHLCSNPEVLPTVYLTLAGWIKQGNLKISLKDLSSQEYANYHSVDFQQLDPITQMLDVIFIKKD